jgi:hypothetical protein
MLFTAQWWPAPAAGALALALLIEAIGFEVFCDATKQVAVVSRLKVFLGAVVVFVVSAGIGFGGTMAMWFADGLLLLALAWSLIRQRSHSLRVRLARVGVIALGLTVGLLMALPSQRPLQTLLDTGLYVTMFRVKDGWLVDELRRREETRAALRPLLAGDQNEKAIALHATLGFPLEERRSACAALESPHMPEVAKEACGRDEPPDGEK